MMETDDKLIREFMLSGKKEVADNGFTRRVMTQLPQRNFVAAIVVAMVLFVVMAFLFVTSGAAQMLVLKVRDIVVDSLKEGTFVNGVRSCGVLFIGVVVLVYQKIGSLS